MRRERPEVEKTERKKKQREEGRDRKTDKERMEKERYTLREQGKELKKGKEDKDEKKGKEGKNKRGLQRFRNLLLLDLIEFSSTEKQGLRKTRPRSGGVQVLTLLLLAREKIDSSEVGGKERKGLRVIH